LKRGFGERLFSLWIVFVDAPTQQNQLLEDGFGLPNTALVGQDPLTDFGYFPAYTSTMPKDHPIRACGSV